MSPASSPTPCPQTRRGFALWVAVMLLVVLLSALPGNGQARSRLVGSAFDPTTVSVALSPKQPKAKASLQASDQKRLRATTSGEPASLPANRFLSGIFGNLGEAGAQTLHRSAPPVAARSLTRAHGPRAPPAA